MYTVQYVLCIYNSNQNCCPASPTVFTVEFLPYNTVDGTMWRCIGITVISAILNYKSLKLEFYKVYVLSRARLIVPDFTVSEYCSSCNYLFCGPILVSLLSLSICWNPKAWQAGRQARWGAKNRWRKKCREKKTKKERISWTAIHRNF